MRGHDDRGYSDKAATEHSCVANGFNRCRRRRNDAIEIGRIQNSGSRTAFANTDPEFIAFPI